MFEHMIVALDLRRSRYFLYDEACTKAFADRYLHLRNADRSSILEPLIFDKIINSTTLPSTRADRDLVFDYRTIRFKDFDCGAWESRTLGKRKTSKVDAPSLLHLIKDSIMLRIFGFHALSALERLQPRLAGTTASSTVDSVEAIDRYLSASMWSPFRITCLPLSFSVAAHLRRNDIPAQLVIGVRPTPFVAHAWIEIGGNVYGDDHNLKKSYGEIYRTP